MPTYLEAYRAARATQQPSSSPAPGPAEAPRTALKSTVDESAEDEQTLPRPAAVVTSAEIPRTQDVKKTPDTKKPGAVRATPAKKTPTKAPIRAPVKTPIKLKLEVGKQQGLYDTKNVRTKIAKWQALDDSVVDVDPVSGSVEAQQSEKPSNNDATVVPAIKQNKARPGEDKENDATEDLTGALRKSTAPKKRVVSDEHWKKSRASPHAATPPTLETKIQNIIIERGFYIPPGGKAPEGWVRKLDPLPVKKVEPVQKTPMPPGTPTKASIGKWAATIEETSAEVEEIMLEPSRPEQKRSSVKKSKHEAPDISRNHKQAPKEVEPKEKSETTPDRATAGKSLKRKPVNSTPPPPTSSNTNPMLDRMQAWLEQTDDPFIDDLEEDDHGPSKVAGPSALGSLLAPRSTGVRDRDHQHEHHRRRRRSLEVGSSSHDRTDIEPKSPPTSGLKRSGARRLHLPPNTHADVESSVVVEPGWQITGKSSTSSREHDMAMQLAPLAEYDRVAPNLLSQLQLNQSSSRPPVKREVTSEEELMSVLSFSHQNEHDVRPPRRLRTKPGAPNDASVEDVVAELRSDDTQYLKDLQTLVDGVIPVLLNHVLTGSQNKTLSPVRSSTDLSKLKDAIVNLAVALERLSAAHKRPPITDIGQMASWAERTHDIYADYIHAWRLGFQDIVVNLAPINSGDPKDAAGTVAEGDAVQAGSERADVTFLLKRPLVRLKHMAKTVRDLDRIAPTTNTANLVEKYQALVDEARSKQDQERARLEDDAAASIDTTRARDPLSLAPLPGVTISTSRVVRARDIFDLHLHHSSGQRLESRVSLLLRDEEGTRSKHGDVLVCQLENATKWLLFPPADFTSLSARYGDTKRDIVVMLRGISPTGQSWHELLSLTASSEATAQEWVEMLGSHPMPPVNPSGVRIIDDDAISLAGTAIMSTAGTEVAPSDIDIPLGERSVVSDHRPRNPRVEAWVNTSLRHDDRANGRVPPALHGPRTLPSDHASSLDSATLYERRGDYDLRDRNASANYAARAKHNLKNLFADVKASIIPPPQLENRKAREPSRYDPPRPRPLPRYPSSLPGDDPEEPEDDDFETLSQIIPRSPVTPQRVNMDGSPRPAISPRPPLRRPLSTIMSESVLTVAKSHVSDGDQSPTRSVSKTEPSTPASALPMSRQRYRHQRTVSESQALPIVNKSANSAQSVAGQTRTALTAKLNPSTPKSDPRRRSSSPLKYEYEPSSPSEASFAAEDLHSDGEESFTSESSVDNILSQQINEYGSLKQSPMRSKPSSTYSPTGAGTLGPSQSASQAPYRTVPEQSVNRGANRMIASIFSWSNKGFWDLLHPDECSVIVSPGLIEAFKLSASHSIPKDGEHYPLPSEGNRPLIVLELTPLVPLRQGTALDISIRSPPTTNSLIRTGNNIMFRSRTGGECDALYQLINQARINNPTYLALQNARPNPGGGWSSYMDKQASQRGGSSSWWRLSSKKGSYRASTRRGNTASVAETRSSVQSMSSAISALKRFSGGSNVFNVAKSTITSGAGLSNRKSRTSTWTSSSGGTGGSGSGNATPAHAYDPSKGSPAGITDTKIRLYERETAGKWRDMGRARLTIMHPPRPASTAAMISPTGHLKQEKRVLITGKTRGEMLLDVTLGETSFERVARTGIAVMVGEQLESVRDTGGVMSARQTVYMIQMKSEAEAAYTFSIVGRLRY